MLLKNLKTATKIYYNNNIIKKKESDNNMDKTDMPANLSYTLLIHAGSYKDFTKKIAKDFADLEIRAVKQKAIHYYIVWVSENGNTEYTKEALYKLPIMAMREEFSNYMFFKSIKAYNNVLKLMLNGKENKQAPYDLFKEMMTPIEKYKFGEVDNTIKNIQYTNGTTNTSVYGTHIFDAKTLEEVFVGDALIVEGKPINLIDKLKEQHLRVGVI